MESLVSVIIPTYKRPSKVIRAINSVLNQTYKNIEILVIDDNGKDSEFSNLTKQALNQLIFKNKIKYIQHECNSGLPSARNTGIKIARGEYISFLDDDDEYLPIKIESQLKIFKNAKDNIGLVYGAYLRKDLNMNTEILVKPKLKGNFNSIMGLNKIGTPSIVICKKRAIDKIGGFDETFKYKEDIDFYFRLSEYFDFDYTKEVVTRYYVHPNVMSDNYKQVLIHTIKYIKKHYTKFKRPRKRWSELQELLGTLYLLNDLKVKALIAYFSAYINRPLRMVLLLRIILSLFGKRIFDFKKKYLKILNY